MSDNGFVNIDIKNGIATMTFFHPKKNALPGHLLTEMAQGMLALGGNDQARVVVLQSAGSGPFCAGASFDELLAVDSFERSKAFFMGFARLILAMRRIPKFVIVRVQGKAVGGGVGIIAAADYALASDRAAVKLSEFALGFGPFIIGPAVERKIGKAAFSALAADTEWRDAQWCKTNGLFAGVFAGESQLDEAVHAMATKLAKSSEEATAHLKKVFWAGTEHWDELLEERAEMSSRLVLSEFTQNAIAAFKKR